MPEINLLARYPKAKRNVKARMVQKEENRRIALQFGREYFDGTREQGYGGYRYDGRWIPIAEDIVRHYGLRPGDRVLDVGCAKGFLVKDLLKVCPGLDVRGVDVSEYAIQHAEPEIRDRVQVGNAKQLPFADDSFDLVIAINTVHNLDRSGCIRALREIERVSRKHSFVQVDAYRSEAERKLFEEWMLTARTYGTPSEWIGILAEAGYTGDYFWTILEADPEVTLAGDEDRAEGMVAVVTGASGTIGGAVVRMLAARGGQVIAASRSCTPGDEKARFGAESGGRISSKTVDVTNETDVKGLMTAVRDEHGKLDLLVTAAGTYGAIGRVVDVPPSEWRRAIESNLVGAYICCHHALPMMIEAHCGRIINVAGGGSTGPLENLSSYAASKSALVRLTDTIAQEVREYGIAVNAVLPGAVDSAMQDQLLSAGDRAGPWYAKIKALRDSGQGGVPAQLTMDLIDFLVFGAGRGLSGKLLSARYDAFSSWGPATIDRIRTTDLFGLRRLDPATLAPIVGHESLGEL